MNSFMILSRRSAGRRPPTLSDASKAAIFLNKTLVLCRVFAFEMFNELLLFRKHRSAQPAFLRAYLMNRRPVLNERI